MFSRIFRTADGQSGIFFAAIGVFFSWYALGYPLGSVARMGPGMFPLIIGLLLVLVSLFILARTIANGADLLPRFDWKGTVIVTGAVLVSGALLLRVGLLAAIPALVIISAFASTRPSPKWIAVMTVAITFFAWLLFIAGLGLRIPLWRL